MEKAISPKRLQREGKLAEALGYDVARYKECIEEQDPFLSGLYLDEIAQTLIALNPNSMSFENLKHKLSEAVRLDSLNGRAAEQASLDIQITLRKRFPGRFKEVDSEEIEPAD